jgi:hypothetical protein
MIDLLDPVSVRDARLGMAWWNALATAERRYWMDVAGNTGIAADAWHAFKRSLEAAAALTGAP